MNHHIKRLTTEPTTQRLGTHLDEGEPSRLPRALFNHYYTVLNGSKLAEIFVDILLRKTTSQRIPRSVKAAFDPRSRPILKSTLTLPPFSSNDASVSPSRCTLVIGLSLMPPMKIFWMAAPEVGFPASSRGTARFGCANRPLIVCGLKGDDTRL